MKVWSKIWQTEMWLLSTCSVCRRLPPPPDFPWMTLVCGYRAVGAFGRLNDAGLTVRSKLSVWRLGRPSGKQNYNSYNQPRLGCVWVDSKLFCTNTQRVHTVLLTSCLRVNEWLYEWTAHTCEYDVHVDFLSHSPTNKFCFFSRLPIWSLVQTVLCCHNASPHTYSETGLSVMSPHSHCCTQERRKCERKDTHTSNGGKT